MPLKVGKQGQASSEPLLWIISSVWGRYILCFIMYLIVAPNPSAGVGLGMYHHLYITQLHAINLLEY